MRVERGRVEKIEPMPLGDEAAIAGKTIDLGGDWLSLGGVDLQINGGLGLAFPDLRLEHLGTLAKISEFLWQQGVDGYLPTLVTTSVENIHRSLAVLKRYKAEATGGAQVWGVHLEGPFLNPAKRGAHPAAYLQALTLDNVRGLLGKFADLVKVITLAPELDPTGQVIPWLKEQGIIVSLGHSLATAGEAAIAFDQGATMVTHAFNAMPGLHHREPGLLGTALAQPGVSCGFIADGQHISPTMLKLFLRMQRQAFLVSDALSPLGLPDGVYAWDSREIEVKDGTARLPDGTLAGTTRPLLDGVKNLAQWGLCEVEEAIATATTAPRAAIGLSEAMINQPAQFLRWRWDADKKQLTWARL
ncbi:N-acetylglucosamine-6-phosphate deacetylase [Romeria aff. gracilis LEGE 07310]|uniref:N-acetylglucosamine-6-phosphate deacetylase n=1 Tax=Vasconcelosia minhoensis LEGE 07310 TaxID=915328 RepID=A0A8J7DD28_9CYAN|nr:N-acetylglucosamine-6-phosphate deacetylase [Romeria aff. gracilis LEGE 07310]